MDSGSCLSCSAYRFSSAWTNPFGPLFQFLCTVTRRHGKNFTLYSPTHYKDEWSWNWNLTFSKCTMHKRNIFFNIWKWENHRLEINFVLNKSWTVLINRSQIKPGIEHIACLSKPENLLGCIRTVIKTVKVCLE